MPFWRGRGGRNAVDAIGRIVQSVWAKISIQHPGFETDAFTVMPNHVHGIIVVTDLVGAQFIAPQFIAPHSGATHQGAINRGAINRAPTVGEIVRAYKARVTIAVNRRRGTPRTPVWQRNYYEHVVRNEGSLNRIRQYIADNPAQWSVDRENPNATVPDPQDPWRS